MKEPVTLFAPRQTTRFRFGEHYEDEPSPGYVEYQTTGPITVAFNYRELPTGEKTKEYLDAGKNPPEGVIIHYAFAQKPEGEVTLSIHDAEGNAVRTFSSKTDDVPHVPVEQGANRFVWNMRYERPGSLVLDDKKEEAKKRQGLEDVAPRALSGEYEVRLTANDTTVSQRFTIVPDPRLPVSADDLRQQFELKRAIRDRVSEANEAINQIRRTRKQVEAWEERAKAGTPNERLANAAAALKGKLTALESEFTVTDQEKPRPGPAKLVERLVTLSSMIDESDDVPTQGARDVFASLSERVQARQSDLRRIVAEDVAAFNALVRELDVPAVSA